MIPLVSDPFTQLGTFAVSARNVAVPLDLAMVDKLTETVFPGLALIHI